MSSLNSYAVAPEVLALMDLNCRSFQAEEDGSWAALEPCLAAGFLLVRGKGDTQRINDPALPQAVKQGAGIGRQALSVDIRLCGDKAVVTSLLATTRGQF